MRSDILPRLLTQAAGRFPQRTAVVDPGSSLTYAELEHQANRLAHVLRDLGVRPGHRVGLYLKKSADALIGVYGIMKTGAAYVPLDLFAPAPRLAYIARNCDLEVLVTGVEQAAAWPHLLAQSVPVRTLVCLNADVEVTPPSGNVRIITRQALRDVPEVPPEIATIDLDLAYILYTSGSTGQPKGVMISHLNALTYVRWCHKYFAPTEQDVFSCHAPLHFDLTILDLYTAAMSGSRLVVVPPEVSVFPMEMAAFIERHGITIWYSVPSALSMLTVHGNLDLGRLRTLRHVIFAGEVFPTKYLRALMRLLPHAQFTNLYGPTETNVCTYYRVPPLSEEMTGAIPIGRSIDNVEAVAITEDGRVAGVGEVGELYVRGTTVAYGYWGDPEKTERCFLTNPLGPTPDRTYRTGDLVKLNAKGDYQFLGRRDHQIKSRGYRIEIGDIETALYAHPEVAECCVVPVPDELIGNRIKAFVVLRDGTGGAEELSRFVGTLLPKYMVPESFEVLAALPKTSSGKVDRQSLIAPVQR